MFDSLRHLVTFPTFQPFAHSWLFGKSKNTSSPLPQVIAFQDWTGNFRATMPQVGILSVIRSWLAWLAKSVRPGLWAKIITSL